MVFAAQTNGPIQALNKRRSAFHQSIRANSESDGLLPYLLTSGSNLYGHRYRADAQPLWLRNAKSGR